MSARISSLPVVVSANIADTDILPIVVGIASNTGVTKRVSISELRLKLGTTPPAAGRTVTSTATYLANNAVFNVKDFGAFGDGVTNDSVAIQAAITAAQLSGDGSKVYFPPGLYLFSSTIAPTKALIFEGGLGGTSNAGQHSGPTLIWNGGASPMISLSGSAVTNLRMQGFLLNNIGSATIGIDIEGTGEIHLLDVALVTPTVAFSDSGVSVGMTASCTNIQFHNVTCRQAAQINMKLGSLTALMHIWGGSFMDPAVGGTSSVVIGTATLEAKFVRFHGTTFECSTDNVSNIQVLRTSNLRFDSGCYFEVKGASGVALDIPNTAVVARDIKIVDARFGAISGSPYAVRSNFASALIKLEGNYLDGTFTGFLDSQSVRHAYVAKNTYSGSGLIWASVNKGVTFFQNEQAGSTKVRDNGYFIERDFTSVTNLGNTLAAETDLAVATVVANRLYENDMVARVTAWGTTAANANGKQIKLYVGGTVVLDSGSLAANNKAWSVTATIIRNGLTTALVIAEGQFNGAVIQTTHTGVTVSSTGWDAAQIIKMTGTGVATNDILQKGMLVEVSN